MIKGKDITCDGCWSHEYVDVIGFRNKIKHVKSEGWKIKKVLNEWHHYCPDCVEERKHIAENSVKQPDSHANNYWWND